MSFLDVSAVTTVAALVGGIAIIIGGIIAVYKIAKRVEGAIGVDAHGRTVSERLAKVEHQLWPNGGDSLADRVNDLDQCARDTSTQVGLIRDLLVGIVHGTSQGAAGRSGGSGASPAFGLQTPQARGKGIK